MGEDRKVITIAERRREICNDCKHQIVVIGANICNKCGCSIWAKSLIPNAKCPEGKWDEN